MKYENMPCPVCGSHMHEGDDIVVCPDCGTPCHRECWKETGHCINESKHGEGFSFDTARKGTVSDEPSEAKTDAVAETEDAPDDMIVCHICGSENPSTSINCNHCGALLIHKVNGEDVCPICKGSVRPGMAICPNCGASLLQGGQVPFRQYNPFRGKDPDQKIGDNTAEEIGTYVRINQIKYLKKFYNIENKEKVNFNWAAFFFGPFWFLFRKMFLYGMILLLIFSSILLIWTPASDSYMKNAYKIAEEYMPEISRLESIYMGTGETSTSAAEQSQTSASESTTAAESTSSSEDTSESVSESTTAADTAAVTSSEVTTAAESTAAESTAAAETTASETTTSMSAEEAQEKSVELSAEFFRKFFSALWKPLLVLFAIWLVIAVLCGFFGDRLYYKKVKTDLGAAKEEIPDPNVRTMLLSRKGGISVLNIICGWFAFRVFLYGLVMIAEYVSDMF